MHIAYSLEGDVSMLCVMFADRACRLYSYTRSHLDVSAI